MATERPEPTPLPASDPASPNHAPVKSTTQARAGVTVGPTRWVLAVSIAAVIVVFLVIWGLTAQH